MNEKIEVTYRLNPFTGTISIVQKADRWTEFFAIGGEYEEDCRSKKRNFRFTYRLKSSETDDLARWTSNPERYLDPRVIRKAEKLCKGWIDKGIPAMIERGKQHPAYNEMLEKSEFIQHYRRDFEYHDLLLLGICPFPAFVWCVYENGTHLLFNDDYKKRGNNTLANAILVKRVYKDDRIYIYDGGNELVLSDPTTAHEFLWRVTDQNEALFDEAIDSPEFIFQQVLKAK